MKKQNVVSLLLAPICNYSFCDAGSGEKPVIFPAPPAIGAAIEISPCQMLTEKTRTQLVKGGKWHCVDFHAVQCPVLMPTTSEWRNSAGLQSSGINVVGIQRE